MDLKIDPPLRERGSNDLRREDAQSGVKRIEGGNVPVGVLIAPDNRRAFVATVAADKVVVIALPNSTIAGTIDLRALTPSLGLPLS